MSDESSSMIMPVLASKTSMHAPATKTSLNNDNDESSSDMVVANSSTTTVPSSKNPPTISVTTTPGQSTLPVPPKIDDDSDSSDMVMLNVSSKLTPISSASIHPTTTVPIHSTPIVPIHPTPTVPILPDPVKTSAENQMNITQQVPKVYDGDWRWKNQPTLTCTINSQTKQIILSNGQVWMYDLTPLNDLQVNLDFGDGNKSMTSQFINVDPMTLHIQWDSDFLGVWESINRQPIVAKNADLPSSKFRGSNRGPRNRGRGRGMPRGAIAHVGIHKQGEHQFRGRGSSRVPRSRGRSRGRGRGSGRSRGRGALRRFSNEDKKIDEEIKSPGITSKRNENGELMIKFHSRPLGFSVYDKTSEGERTAVAVKEVLKETLMFDHGLYPDMIIISINGKRVRREGFSKVFQRIKIAKLPMKLTFREEATVEMDFGDILNGLKDYHSGDELKDW